jgi:hypothetical protein
LPFQGADPFPIPGVMACRSGVLIQVGLAALSGLILPPIWTRQCGDSGTVRDGFFVFPECGGGVEGF